MCPYCRSAAGVRKKGFYSKRSTRAENVQRYFCRPCRRSFSSQTGRLTYKDKKPHHNQAIYRLVCSGLSQARIAASLHVSRITVARKICKIAIFARRDHRLWQAQRQAAREVQFDEMQTFEHSKCKPISIGLAICKDDRSIVAAHAATMPATGLLAARSRKKYGRRPDLRPFAMRRLMEDIRTTHHEVQDCIRSDKKSSYGPLVARYLPTVRHEVSKGRRGCVVGQGELKAGGYDPLFNLNHNAAMIRDNLKTMSRRTWCTVKRLCRFMDLLDLYVHFHNRFVVMKIRSPVVCGDPIM